ILNRGTLALSNTVFRGNSTAGDYGRGGAIYNEFGAALTIDRCVFDGNSSTGAHTQGGGVYVFGNATINDCTFAENTSAEGGALQTDYFGAARINRCTFSGNLATNGPAQGGGLHNVG